MKRPKPRIKRVFEKVVENNGFNVGKAMIEEGYSPNSAKNPKQVTESKSWEMLMDKYIPESLILKTHKEAFEANKVISARTMGNANENTDDFIDVPDWQTRTKAVEIGYKVRGRFTDKSELTIKSLKGLINVKENDKFESMADDSQEGQSQV